MACQLSVIVLSFQSTPPRGGRPSRDRSRCCLYRFQSTPPRGGRPTSQLLATWQQMFQSTPPRGGRPSSLDQPPVFTSFNPRPRAGGDQLGNIGTCNLTWFQSTPPRGGRHPPASGVAATRRVSIHAPARGATRPYDLYRPAVWSFNPRPRAGGDTTSTTGNS